MGKRAVEVESRMDCGIDVSAAELVGAVRAEGRALRRKVFANRAQGHLALIGWLQKLGPARVSLEATGIYSLDLALALDAAEGVAVGLGFYRISTGERHRGTVKMTRAQNGHRKGTKFWLLRGLQGLMRRLRLCKYIYCLGLTD